MRNILLVVGIAGLVGCFSACGNNDHAGVPDDASGSSGRTGTHATGGANDLGGASDGLGGTGAAAEGGAGNGQPNPADAPVVTLTSPEPSLTPADGALTEDVVHVVCKVEKSTAATAEDVNPASIKLALRDGSGMVLEEKDASSTKTAGEYAADFILTTVQAGKISFLCSASDRNSVTGTDLVSSFLDHGPVITVVSPAPDSATALKGGLEIEFHVDPAPLAKGDADADVDEVTFTFDGKTVELHEAGGTYQASLQLDDTDTFPVVPNGAIIITAKNKRSPDPATATLAYSIVIDAQGPVLTIDQPVDKARVGGKVTVSFTATDDASGVDPKSVYLTRYLGEKPIFCDETMGWTHQGNNYTFTFDSKELEPFAQTQAVFNVRATDLAGNPSAEGQSVVVYLDNVPPQIDLDPRNVRFADKLSCSGSFDPVGPAALNDLQGAFGKGELGGRIGMLRVFVNEQTNSEPRQTQFWHAGTDQTTVRMYIQPDPEHAETPLLVNKNPRVDDTCDDIGGVDDIQKAPHFNAMKPISAAGPSGNIWVLNDGAVEPKISGCTATDEDEPEHLCEGESDMWYVAFNHDLKEPYVYVAATPDSTDLSCTGVETAFLTAPVPDGWVCVSARVVDKAGNVGISPPLRLCADDPKPGDPHPECATSSVLNPPSCTDGCTPPARGGGFFVR